MGDQDKISKVKNRAIVAEGKLTITKDWAHYNIFIDGDYFGQVLIGDKIKVFKKFNGKKIKMILESEE